MSERRSSTMGEFVPQFRTFLMMNRTASSVHRQDIQGVLAMERTKWFGVPRGRDHTDLRKLVWRQSRFLVRWWRGKGRRRPAP
jgi:hypothetical protein